MITMTGLHEDGARRALLGRLATGLEVMAGAPWYHWECCWLNYAGPGGLGWSWQRCGGQMPGGLPQDDRGRHVHCGHWHHRWEVFIA